MIEHFKDPHNATEAEVISAPPGCLFWVDEPQYVGRWLAVAGPPGFIVLRGAELGSSGETRICPDIRQELGELLRGNSQAIIECFGNIHQEQPIQILERWAFFGVKPVEDAMFDAILSIIKATEGMVK